MKKHLYCYFIFFFNLKSINSKTFPPITSRSYSCESREIYGIDCEGNALIAQNNVYERLHKSQVKICINNQFYKSIVKIVLFSFLKSLKISGSYVDHYFLAKYYMYEFLREKSEKNILIEHEKLGNVHWNTAWDRKINETVLDYQKRIIDSAKQVVDIFSSRQDFVFDAECISIIELVDCITAQFVPFYIKTDLIPWFIPPQGGCNFVNWFDFIMNARGKINGFLMWQKVIIYQVNLSVFEGVTTLGHNFLQGCPGLKEIDFSPLSQLTSVGDNFLGSNNTFVGFPIILSEFFLKQIQLFLNEVRKKSKRGP